MSLSKTPNRDLRVLDAGTVANTGVAAAAAATIQRHGVILQAMKDSSGPAEAIVENACIV
jgi:hypothetical protein